MKKKYINPETLIVEVELQHLMQASKILDGDTSNDFEELGKENEISSGSIWGEEE